MTKSNYVLFMFCLLVQFVDLDCGDMTENLISRLVSITAQAKLQKVCYIERYDFLKTQFEFVVMVHVLFARWSIWQESYKDYRYKLKKWY